MFYPEQMLEDWRRFFFGRLENNICCQTAVYILFHDSLMFLGKLVPFFPSDGMSLKRIFIICVLIVFFFPLEQSWMCIVFFSGYLHQNVEK
jgi:hypothetical protein